MKPIETGRAPVTLPRHSFAFCVLTIFLTLALPDRAAGREIVSRTEGYGESVLPSGVFRFERDARLDDILRQRPTSVESFLALTPDFIRQNHTLISQSGSIQSSSPIDPRAIMATPTASLVLTFAGHADASGGRAIEAMDYNPVTNRYDFHEISWSGGRMSDAINPRKCTACHTDANMPNWRPYHDWRESYATINDHFGNSIVHARDAFGRAASAFVPNEAAPAAFRNFIATKTTNGDRYKFLTTPPGLPDATAWPFGSSTVDFAQYALNRIDIEPNRRLGVGLIFHWSRSLGARLEKTRLFRDHPASLAAGLLECDGRAPEFTRALEAARAAVDTSSTPSIVISNLIKANGIGGSFEYGPKIHHFYKFLNSLVVADVSPESWVTNYVLRDAALRTENLLGDNGLTSFSGFAEMNEVPLLTGLYLVGALARRDPSLDVPVDAADGRLAAAVGVPIAMLSELGRVIPLYGTESITRRICPQLVARARAEATDVAIETSPAVKARVTDWAAGHPYVIQRCAACHDHQSFEGAPKIAFDHPDQLRAQLRADGGALLENIRTRTAWTAPDDLRMPKGAYAMPSSQRRQLLRYLKRIQAGA